MMSVVLLRRAATFTRCLFTMLAININIEASDNKLAYVRRTGRTVNAMKDLALVPAPSHNLRRPNNQLFASQHCRIVLYP